MGLKQNIVVVNEYTIRKSGSRKGSRGGSPGAYVLRYMARDGATEDVTPVRLQDQDSYIVRYMARANAVEKMSSVPEMKQEMKNAEKLGGIAFDNNEVSMSDQAIRRKSKEIQKAFDDGKTVLKTVLSFDTDYLKKVGIISDDFELEKRGDLRGNVDQMKMRLAIQQGMKRMGKSFDDLQWVGTLQVDTEHLHCHLCMVDMGRGNLAKDGTQRGKLSENQKRTLRRGIDLGLDEMSPVKQMASNITHDKRNAKCFIKKFTHDAMSRNGTPQFLLACLPEDRSMWRAGTNRKEMQKPNAIVKEYVTQVLNEPKSGYREAMQDIYRYADHRRREEDLSMKKYRSLIETGQKRLIEDCMNGVYSVLKQIPDSERRVTTPMLDIMSRDYEVLASQIDRDPLLEFGFKLRSYGSRLRHHREEKNKYRSSRMAYEEAKEKKQVSEDSKPLYEFYKFEEEYNRKLMSKYQEFLSFLPSDRTYKEEFDALLDARDKLQKMDYMRHDGSMKKMYAENAEEYGREVYGHHGGRFMTFEPDILDQRYARMKASYDRKEEDFREKLADYGLKLVKRKNNDDDIVKEKAYPFEEVKALDIHHLLYDFPYDAPIAKRNVDVFRACAEERYEKYEAAAEYLKATGQKYYLRSFPVQDIEAMKRISDQMQTNTVLPTKKTTTGKSSARGTIRLDRNYDDDLHFAIKTMLEMDRAYGE